MARLIRTYAQETKKFQPPAKQYPFIFLVDNDSGAKEKGGIFSAVISATKGVTKVDPTKPHVHVSANLFVAPTPQLAGGLDSQMEDFFDPATKAVVINGKSFDSTNEYDTAAHYGKHIFAQKVVLANASTIDFRGFSKILENISAIIDLYGSAPAP